MIDIGLVIFPGVQQLDFTAPYEVFSTWGGARVHLVWKTREVIVASTGLRFEPSAGFGDCPALDVICVPGGAGINRLLLDDDVLAFLREKGREATFATSACTGALLLGAAGLLRGKRATTHWAYLDLLPAFGAVATKARVVRDGAVVTGGGVTAGLDFALALIGELSGREAAETT